MADERKIINKSKLLELNDQISLEAHVRRYKFVRPYTLGRVLDCACGSGYGSHLISQNPTVEFVVGLDSDHETICTAKTEFHGPKNGFICSDLRTFTDPRGFDTLVSLETIEHLDDPGELKRLATRNQIQRVILSFPAFKSTHTNPFHKHDLTVEGVRTVFSPDYVITDTYDYLREVWFVFLCAAGRQARH